MLHIYYRLTQPIGCIDKGDMIIMKTLQQVIKKVPKVIMEVKPTRKIKCFNPMIDDQYEWLENTVLLWMTERSLIKLTNWVCQKEEFKATPQGYLNMETGEISWHLDEIGYDDELLARALIEIAIEGRITIYEDGRITLNSAI